MFEVEAPASEESDLQRGIAQLSATISKAGSVREILTALAKPLLEIFEVQRASVFAVDVRKGELYTIFKVGNEVNEIRVGKNMGSIVGYVAVTGKVVNIRNVYDEAELGQIHENLRFDSRWDSATGFTTKQVLCAPITYEGYILGVLQLLNKTSDRAFDAIEENAVRELCSIVGAALYRCNRQARASKPTKYGYLVDRGMVTEAELTELAEEARSSRTDVNALILDKKGIPKEELGKALSLYYNAPFFSYDGAQRMPEEFLEKVTSEQLFKLRCAPVGVLNDRLQVAIDDPHDLPRIDTFLAYRLSPKTDFVVALTGDIFQLVQNSYGLSDEEAGDVNLILQEMEGDDDMGVVQEDDDDEEGVTESDSAVVKLANQIIRDAYRAGVSDIHIEPNGPKRNGMVRFRVDGQCRIYQEIPGRYFRPLVARLKIMAELDISERRLPQDGKIKFRMASGKIELRVATLPTQGGNEDIVMRILAASKPLPLDKMGFAPLNLKMFQDAVIKPYGLILCVGPTGSGKTTTLHSALGYINKPERKIWTAEDPVEITQAGLRQVQMHPKIGLDFARAMRAFLRADPDVIMVGEMRDHETAATGIEASLTGHLVFSTLHTNSAPETVTRLLDMDLDPFSFADSLLLIIAQRLGRTLCGKCKEPYEPTEKEIEELVTLAGGQEYYDEMVAMYEDGPAFHRPTGCTACSNTGYKGRVGIHEVMPCTDEQKAIIQRQGKVSEILEQAMKDGMRTLMQDGIYKVIGGKTDITQVKAVCIK